MNSAQNPAPAVAPKAETTDKVEPQAKAASDAAAAEARTKVKIVSKASNVITVSVAAGTEKLEPGKPVAVSPEFAEQATYLSKVERV